MNAKENTNQPQKLACGCPGSNAKTLERKATTPVAATTIPAESQLMQWPVQIHASKCTLL